MSKRQHIGKKVSKKTPCEQFTEKCGTDTYDLTGDDWCDIDEKFYINVGEINQNQVNCHSLDFLIKIWEAQLDTGSENDFPTPKWPTEPYTRIPISPMDLITWSTRYVYAREFIPEKLGNLVWALMTGNLDMTETDLSDPGQLAELEGVDGLLFPIVYPGGYVENYNIDYDDGDQFDENAENEENVEQDDKVRRKNIAYELIKNLFSNQDIVIQDLLSEEEFRRYINTTLETVFGNPIATALREIDWDIDMISTEELTSRLFSSVIIQGIDIVKRQSGSGELTTSEKNQLKQRLNSLLDRVLRIVREDVDSTTVEIGNSLINAFSPETLFSDVVSFSFRDLVKAWDYFVLAVLDGLVSGLFNNVDNISNIAISFAYYLLPEIPGINDQSKFLNRITRTLSRIIVNYDQV